MGYHYISQLSYSFGDFDIVQVTLDTVHKKKHSTVFEK